MRNGPTLLLAALVAFLLGWGYLKMAEAHAVQVARLQSSNDSLDHALVRQDSVLRARSIQEGILERDNAILRARASQRSHATDTLIVRVAIQDSSFRDRLADTLKAAFDSLRVSHNSIVAGLHDAMQDLVQALQRSDVGLALRDTSLSECAAGLKVALEQRNAFRRLAHPPFWKAAFKNLPRLLVAGSVGWVLGHR